MKILLAFDKFKGALTAGEACRIAADVIREELPEARVDLAPLTDGGEGFCEALTFGAGGSIERVPVTDPLGREIEAPLGWVDGGRLPRSAAESLGLSGGGRIAVVEMAAASGLLLLSPEERDPWKTGTQGTGQLIRHAADRGAEEILLGIGGSATNDGGCGALEALGADFLDGKGESLPRIRPELFESVDRIRLPEKADLPRLIIASDVNSPLLGPSGATAVFGPQKGLEDVGGMEASLARISNLLGTASRFPLDAEAPGSGAAGGIGYGLSALATIRMRPGFDLVSTWLGLEKRTAEADWVVTGEGRLDRSSLTGKGPVALLRLAGRLGAKTAVFAGALQAGSVDRLSEEIPGLRAVALSHPDWSLEYALAQTGGRLAEEVRIWCGELS